MLDTKALAEATALVVREYFQKHVAPLIAENGELKARLDALERRAPDKGEPGKDADPALIERMVADAVAALPAPKDGKDVDPDAVKAWIVEAVAALPAPKDGRDADPETIKSMVADAVAALPTPRDGHDADPEAIKAAVADAVAALPVPKDGKDAAPYAPDPDEVRSLLAPIVREYVAALPPPKDGVSVTLDDVRPLVDDAVSKAVSAIPAPKDGIGLAGALIDRGGNLVVTLTNGEARALGEVVGRDADMAAIDKAITEKVAAIPVPKDGNDGRDAFQLEDFEASVLDDGRTIRFAMTAGGEQRAYHLPFPVVIDRGVYRDGQKYEQGDAVTWAGSIWIAQKETEAKPDAGDGWRLSVKRGRDGKDKVA